MRKIVLTTGGTGGHIFPALAVAEVLRKEYPHVDILFVGSEYGPEKELVAKAGIRFEGLSVRGVIGRGAKAMAATGLMVKAIMQARHIVKEFSPDVVLGFGGYAAFAPIFTAKLCHIPTAIHEQNAVMGVSNKILGKMADKIFLSMPLMDDASRDFSTGKMVITGNPVREDMVVVGQKEHDFSGRNLLVMGGSLGAKALNDAIIEHGKMLLDQGIKVRHVTGHRDFERVQEAYVANGLPTEGLCAFVDDMAQAYAEADLVLCRAGASTVAELAAVGRGALFVPYPHATHDHQSYNARLLSDVGAARTYVEKKMLAQGVIDTAVKLLHDPKILRGMAKAAKEQSRPQAAQDMVQHLHGLAGS